MGYDDLTKKPMPTVLACSIAKLTGIPLLYKCFYTIICVLGLINFL